MRASTPTARASSSTALDRLALLAGLALAALLPAVHAQAVRPQPVTDSSAQASPLTPVPRAPVDDTSTQASPVSTQRNGRPSIAPHTPVPIALSEDIDSGTLKQGQEVKARLTSPVTLHGGATLPAGTPVTLSVIATVPAGRIAAQGEFSLQLLRVGSVGVYTDTLVFEGKPGHQDLPDSAPALGTNAGLPNGAPLTFHVQPEPTFAESAPQNREDGPGSVDGVSSGGPPPPSTQGNTYSRPNGAGSGNTPAQQQRTISPGDTTTGQQTQRLGQPSVAPNQPQSPAQNAPTATRPQSN